jgi:hypothetical protein
MKNVAGLLVLCLILAVLKAVVLALVLALILALVWSFITQPHETLVFLGTVILTSLAVAQPLAFIAGMVAIVVVAAVVGRKRHRPNANQLDHFG